MGFHKVRCMVHDTWLTSAQGESANMASLSVQSFPALLPHTEKESHKALLLFE